MAKKRLFEEADLGSDEEVEVGVNGEDAAHLEHSKRREELHRLEEKFARTKAAASSVVGSEEGSSSSEEELDVLEELQDEGFLRALAKAKGRVSVVEEESSEGSSDDGQADSEPSETARRKEKKEKPVLLKHVVHDAEEDEDDTEAVEAGKPYVRDMEDTRRDFFQAVETSELGENLFVRRGRGEGASQPSGSSSRRQTQSMQDQLDRYFGRDEELSQDDLFLKRFVTQPDYAEDGDDAGKSRGARQLQDSLEEDEAHLEQAERFEAEHNFRFEERGSAVVKTYPRSLDGIVRQADTRRAEVRGRKKQRRAQEEARHQAQVQRMKNLKRQEIEDRLRQVQKHSGLDGPDANLENLLASADFDGEEYDKVMEKIFGSTYYEAQEQEDLEGDEDALEGGDDEAGPQAQGGFQATRQKLAAASTGREVVRDAAAVQELLREYNKLDYEDIVAGMPTRFGYRKVEKADHGLSTTDILLLSDKELNQVVGLKRIAPYRQERDVRKSHFQGRHRINRLRSEKEAEDRKLKTRVEETEQHPNAEISEEEKRTRAREHRLATFAKPQLKRSGPKKEAPKMVEAAPEGAALTKAQKRNSRRSRIRGSKSQPVSLGSD